jgi:hypothetical protein
MSNIKLTPIVECIDSDEELKDYTTVGLLNYGLRSGCSDAEYHLALRLQELRKHTLALVEQHMAEGYGVGNSLLNLLDVEMEVKETKRFYKIS